MRQSLSHKKEEKNSSLRVVIVEDNATMRLGMEETLRRAGYQVTAFSNGPEALKHLEKQPVSIVITDLKMEPLDGLAVLEQVKARWPESEVILISAYGTVETAVKAMQMGAADFLTKPFSPEELRVRVRKVQQGIQQRQALAKLSDENRLLQEELGAPYRGIIGRSASMQEIYRLIERVAREDSTVLIEGESGTGKELVARAIHRRSPRREKPFIRVNCGALNDNLLESELFGHEKGAFTGAIRRKRGRFELADGGTLFLDEIGDVSPAMQIKLLRVLQEQEFERVGGEETIRVNVRIIAATNRNLRELIARGEFREDLYYRLSVIPVQLPPLRERREDIPLLVNHFLERLCQERNHSKPEISPEGMELLQNYSWPGNIRELENVLERLLVISPDNRFSPELIARHLGNIQNTTVNYQHLPLDEALHTFEKNLLLHALKKAGGIKNRAAKLLGIRTSTLYYKLEKYGLLK